MAGEPQLQRSRQLQQYVWASCVSLNHDVERSVRLSRNAAQHALHARSSVHLTFAVKLTQVSM